MPEKNSSSPSDNETPLSHSVKFEQPLPTDDKKGLFEEDKSLVVEEKVFNQERSRKRERQSAMREREMKRKLKKLFVKLDKVPSEENVEIGPYEDLEFIPDFGEVDIEEDMPEDEEEEIEVDDESIDEFDMAAVIQTEATVVLEASRLEKESFLEYQSGMTYEKEKPKVTKQILDDTLQEIVCI